MPCITYEDVLALRALRDNLEGVARNMGNEVTRRERDYKAALAEAATQALPDLTGKVRKQLEQAHPRFFQDTELNLVFMQHKKVLGLFKPAGYADALAALQFQLARYLESTDTFQELALRIRKLQKARNQTVKRLNDIVSLYDKVADAHRAQAELSQDDYERLTQLLRSVPEARKGEPYGNSRSLVRSSKPIVRQANVDVESFDYDDDTDLLLWLAADIPTSLRTLALDTLQGHHSAPALAPLPFAESHSVPRDTCPPESRAERAEAYCAPVDDSRPAIATDDSLGYFS